MVRKNNKGFSLIEVIVAVAILTLLMAPIIQQVIQTLNTSAQAKERQYAVENAEYILNYMQETPVSKLNILSGKLADGTSTTATIDGGDLQFTGYTKEDKNASLWIIKPVDSSMIDSDDTNAETWVSLEQYLKRKNDYGELVDDTDNVTYSSATYTLEKETMGRGDKWYQRHVTLDNLHAMIAAKGYTIETQIPDSVLSALPTGTDGDDKFKLTTEGALVRYYKDASGEDTPYIRDIVVSKVKGLRSPNGTGTSYMQDLDSSKVAIIQGTASNFDEQAENDLYNLKMALLKKYNGKAWVQAMVRKSPEGAILDTAEYFNDNVSKMTRISIASGYDETRKLKYYDVDCTVFYEDYLIKKNDGTGAKGSEETDPDAAQEIAGDTSSAELNELIKKPQVLTYNAYSKRFYTNQAPDIYLVYEPYVARGSSYSKKDYILTYDGVLYGENEKHSKLYVIKPSSGRVIKYNLLTNDKEPDDWQFNYTSYYTKEDSTYVSVKVQDEVPEYKANTYYERSKDYTTSLNSTSENQVQIYMNYLKENGAGGVSTQIPVYTNIQPISMFTCSLPDNTKDGVQYNGKVTDSESETTTYQDLYYGVEKSSATTMISSSAKYKSSEVTRTAYDTGNIHNISEDVTLSDRVYTVTVQLDKLKEDGSVYKGYSVKLSGAKGAD